MPLFKRKEFCPLSVTGIDSIDGFSIDFIELYLLEKDGGVGTAIDFSTVCFRLRLGDVTVYPSFSKIDLKTSSFPSVASWLNLQSSASSVIVFDSFDEGNMVSVAVSKSFSMFATRVVCDARKFSALLSLSSID